MSLHIGNNVLKNAYVGSNSVKKIYVGDKLVWPVSGITLKHERRRTPSPDTVVEGYSKMLFVSNFGNWIYTTVGDNIVIEKPTNFFDITPISNTYYDALASEHDIFLAFSYSGTYMYRLNQTPTFPIRRNIYELTSQAFRPDLGLNLVDTDNSSQYQSMFLNTTGSKLIYTIEVDGATNTTFIIEASLSTNNRPDTASVIRTIDAGQDHLGNRHTMYGQHHYFATIENNQIKVTHYTTNEPFSLLGGINYVSETYLPLGDYITSITAVFNIQISSNGAYLYAVGEASASGVFTTFFHQYELPQPFNLGG